MAYCRWLSTEHPHLYVRLPTEAEWMSAASPDGRRYPWSGAAEPDATRANFGNRWKAPTPVGIYPAGDGEFGHSDLAGNVREWCLDVANDAQPAAEDLLEWGHPKLVFGGEYWGDADGMEAAKRNWNWSDVRLEVSGFRVATEPTNR
jgi:formylglycine-generating enzyme required for sulfatase activity